MTFDYHAARRELCGQACSIGRKLELDGAARRMTPRQRDRFRAKNLMTDDVWAVRLIANGSLIVELSYTWFLDHPLYGLSVWCVGELAADADAWDFSLSGAFHDIPSLIERVRELDEGGRERIAALAAAA